MNDDRRRELQAEYVLIQGQYEAFDQRALGIKAIAAPVLGAGLAIGAKDGAGVVVAAAVATSLALWVLEVIWKVFQYCYWRRLNELEAWFRLDEPPELAPFQIFTSWGAEFRENWRGRFGKYFELAWQPFVALPYVLVVGGGVVYFGTEILSARGS